MHHRAGTQKPQTPTFNAAIKKKTQLAATN